MQVSYQTQSWYSWESGLPGYTFPIQRHICHRKIDWSKLPLMNAYTIINGCFCPHVLALCSVITQNLPEKCNLVGWKLERLKASSTWQRDKQARHLNSVSWMNYETQVANQLHPFILFITFTIKGCAVHLYPLLLTTQCRLLNLSVGRSGKLPYYSIFHSKMHTSKTSIC